MKLNILSSGDAPAYGKIPEFEIIIQICSFKMEVEELNILNVWHSLLWRDAEAKSLNIFKTVGLLGTGRKLVLRAKSAGILLLKPSSFSFLHSMPHVYSFLRSYAIQHRMFHNRVHMQEEP